MAINSKIKIGIDIRSALGRKAGIGYYTYSLVKALAMLDKENDYLIYTTEKVEWDLPENFTQRVVRSRNILEKIVYIIKTWISYAFKREVDVFFSPNALTFATLGMFSKNVVLTIHDMVPILQRKTSTLNVRFFFLQMPLALMGAKKILVPSKATKNDLLKHTRVNSDKIVTTPEAAHEWCFGETNEEEMKQVKEKYDLPDNFFLFVSTLEPRKNIPNLIKAFARFSYKDTKGYKLVIGGKKGWLYDEIFHEVKVNKIEDKVIFTDYIPDKDLLPLYKQAKIFTFVPIMEGFGLTPLEAMVVGVPVITSNVSSLPEVVGDAALTVSPDNITEISEAMIRLANDEDLRDELIKKGKEQAKKFSWERCAELTLEVFEDVAK